MIAISCGTLLIVTTVYSGTAEVQTTLLHCTYKPFRPPQLGLVIQIQGADLGQP
jgi:hypothetical protein